MAKGTDKQSAGSNGQTGGLKLDEDIEYFRIFSALQHELHRLSAETYQKFKLTTVQKIILRLCARFPGVTPSRLAKSIALPLGTLSGILAKMERSALIERASDTADGRRVQVYVTDKGRKLMITSDTQVEDAIREALSELAARPRSDVKEAFLAFVDSLSSRVSDGT